eukprot:6210870-Pleurochrysis_carterae.AAC.3
MLTATTNEKIPCNTEVLFCVLYSNQCCLFGRCPRWAKCVLKLTRTSAEQHKGRTFSCYLDLPGFANVQLRSICQSQRMHSLRHQQVHQRRRKYQTWRTAPVRSTTPGILAPARVRSEEAHA